MRRSTRPWREKVLADRLRDRHAKMAACRHRGPFEKRPGTTTLDVVCRCGATVETWTVEGQEWVRTYRDAKLPAPTTPDRQPVTIARRRA